MRVEGSAAAVIEPTGHIGASSGLSDDELRAIYRTMALARSLDERMWVLNRSGRVSFVISGQGHEGAQAGVSAVLRLGHDWMLPFYRSVAACLTFGMTPRDIMLGQFAKASDPSSGGRQMPSHFGSREHNIYSSSSPVGTQILHAAGIALAAKIRHTDQVAMVFMGEGASNQGDVHEALNFVGIHKLPMILVVENNGYAISVPAALECAVPDVAVRASGYGMPGVVVDGTDVLACYRAGRDAVDLARSGGGGTFIEAKVTRLTGHSSDDQQTKYRTVEELAHERSRDPLPRFRAQLRDAGILDDAFETAMAAEISQIVDDATHFAESQPDPTPESAAWHVYADDTPGDVAGPGLATSAGS